MHSSSQLADLDAFPYKWEQYKSLKDLTNRSTLFNNESELQIMTTLWQNTGAIAAIYKDKIGDQPVEAGTSTAVRASWGYVKITIFISLFLTNYSFCIETIAMVYLLLDMGVHHIAKTKKKKRKEKMEKVAKREKQN